MAYTYNEEKEFKLLNEGDYECILESMEETTIPTTGTQKLSLKWKVRDDVEQEGKGRTVFEDIWKEKENKQYYNQKRINRLLGAVGNVQEGQEFAGIDDVIKHCVGAYVICHIAVEHDTFNDKDVNRVKYYKSSENKPKEIGSPELTQVPDDDLPF